jgi:hypothetical protein
MAKKSTKRSKAMRKVALKRLNRKKATGNFKKIASKAAKEYGSTAAGKRVAGAIYWKKVRGK